MTEINVVLNEIEIVEIEELEEKIAPADWWF